MSWSKFTITLVIIYACYYLINIILDGIRSKSLKLTDLSAEELTFSEDTLVKEIEEEIPFTPSSIDETKEVVGFETLEEGHLTWERNNDDTEDLTLLSVNTNESTGGITDIAKMIKLIKSDTIQVKHSLVF